MKEKFTSDSMSLNAYHRITHLAIFLLGYFAASVFSVFILCSLGSSFPEQLIPHLVRFLDLFVEWSAGFCFILALFYLSADFIRSRFFPKSYSAENEFIFCITRKISGLLHSPGGEK